MRSARCRGSRGTPPRIVASAVLLGMAGRCMVADATVMFRCHAMLEPVCTALRRLRWSGEHGGRGSGLKKRYTVVRTIV